MQALLAILAVALVSVVDAFAFKIADNSRIYPVDSATSAAPGHVTLGHSLKKCRRPASRLWNVWSNEQAVQDYRDFLDNKPSTTDWKPDQPSCFVFADEPGGDSPYSELLKSLPSEDDHVTTLSELSFPDKIAGHDEYPIYICCHPNSVPALLSSPACQKLRVRSCVSWRTTQ